MVVYEINQLEENNKGKNRFDTEKLFTGFSVI